MCDSPRGVIVITIDALRADHLSLYGYTRETAPRLSQIADNGATFRNAFSASSHTREAIAAFLTGQYPDEAVDAGYRLNHRPISTIMRESEFVTGAFHSNPFVSRAYGFDRGFDEFDDDLHLGKQKFIALFQRALDKLRGRHYARAEAINRRSLNWLDSLDGDEPFFLWNHYMDVHGPYEPPDEYRDMFTRQTNDDTAPSKLYKSAIRDPESITNEERRTLIDCYDAEIRYVDEQIGHLMDELEGRGMANDTLVLITADHGDAFGEHGYYEHPRHLHDELVRVPLIATGAGVPSTVIDAPTSTLDIAPSIGTIADDDTTDYPGRDLFSSVETPNDNRVVFSQARSENGQLRRFSARDSESVALVEYDVDSGRIESENTVGDGSALLSSLRNHVEQRVENVDVDGTGDVDANDEVEQRLSALGYMEEREQGK